MVRKNPFITCQESLLVVEFVGVAGVARDDDVRPVRSTHHAVAILVSVVLEGMYMTSFV